MCARFQSFRRRWSKGCTDIANCGFLIFDLFPKNELDPLSEMNPTKVKINEYLDSLPVELSHLRDIGTRYLKYCSSIDIDDCVQIAHRPWLGCLNYAITFFPPAKKTWISKFRGTRIPKNYQRLLLATNGVFAFGLSLYGLAPSMQKKVPTLNRSKLQCLDLFLANSTWIREYDIDQKLFHFGGREYSRSENIGYFISPDSRVRAFRKNGELHREWTNLLTFLNDELKIAEEIALKNSENGWLGEDV
jgi:hypothetical protein